MAPEGAIARARARAAANAAQGVVAPQVAPVAPVVTEEVPAQPPMGAIARARARKAGLPVPEQAPAAAPVQAPISQDVLTDPREEVAIAQQYGNVPTPPMTGGLRTRLGERLAQSLAVATEAASGRQQGQLPASVVVAGNPATNPSGFAKALFPGITEALGGKPVSFEQMEDVARRDETFRPAWEALKRASLESEKNYRLSGGSTGTDENRARLQQYMEGISKRTAEETEALRPFDRSTSVLTGSKSDDVIPEPRPIMERQEIPGIHRPPLSADEIAKEGFNILMAQRSGARDWMPEHLKVMLNAAGIAVPIAGTARVVGAATRALPEIVRGGLVGAAQTGVLQGSRMESGAQQGFDPVEALIDVVSTGAGSVLGKAAGASSNARNTSKVLRRFGDRAIIAQDLINSGAAAKLAEVPVENRAAVLALLGAGHRAKEVAEGVSTFGEIATELIADRAVANARGQDPGSLAQQILGAVTQFAFGAKLGAGEVATPQQRQLGIDQQTMSQRLEPAMEMATRPDQVQPAAPATPTREALLQQIQGATGQVLERRQGQEAATARKEELIGNLARRAAGDRAQQLYEANESDAALARQALGDRAEMQYLTAEATAARARDANRAESITMAEEARKQRTIEEVAQRLTPQTIDNNPALQQRLAEIERVQGSPVTPGQREMAIRAVIGGQRDVLPKAPEMTKEAIAGRVGEMYQARQPAARQRAGFTGMEKLEIARQSVLRDAQAAQKRVRGAKGAIERSAARAGAQEVLRSAVVTGREKARLYKDKSTYVQAMLLGRDWVRLDSAGRPTRLTAQDALGLAEAISKGKAKVQAAGPAPARRGRPAGVAIALKDGTTVRVYRADGNEAWETVRKALEKGGPAATEFLHSGGLAALFSPAPDPDTAAAQTEAARGTSERFWQDNVRGNIRTFLERLLPSDMHPLVRSLDNFIWTVNGPVAPDIAPEMKRWQQRINDASFAIYKAKKRLEGAINKAAGGDREVAADITSAAFVAAEADAKNWNTGEKVGVPESYQGQVAAVAQRTGNAEFDNIKSLMLAYGKEALRLGNLMLEKDMIAHSIWRNATGDEMSATQEFWNSLGDNATAEKYMRDNGWQLVGGMKQFESAGTYFKHVYALAEAANGLSSLSKWGKHPASSIVGWNIPIVREALKRRNLSLSDALDKGLVLDYEPTVITLAAEAEALKRRGNQDELRKKGLIVNDEEFAKISESPETVAAIKKARTDLLDLRNELARASRELPKLPAEDKKARAENARLQTFLRGEIAELKRHIETLERGLTQEGWIVLRGPEFGRFNSDAVGANGEKLTTWRIRADLLNTIKPAGDQHALLRMFGTLAGLIKGNLTGLGYPFAYIRDAITNVLHNRSAGYSMFSKEGLEQWKLAGRQAWASESGRDTQDELFQQFDFASQVGDMSFGTQADLSEVDAKRAAKAKARLIEAARDGRIADAIADGFELTANNYNEFLDRLGIYGWARKAYKAFTDKRAALFIYRMARLYGPNGSGPLSHEQAMYEAQRAYDMKGISQLWHYAALPFSFIRYRAKLGQQLIQAWEQLPTFYGRRLALADPLTKIIMESPGSGKAQAALGVRGAMNMTLKYLEWKVLMSSATWALLRALDIPEDEWEKSLDAKYSSWPAPIAWFMKQISLPLPRSEDTGKINSFVLEPLLPTIALLKYMAWQDFNKAGFVQQQVNKNVVVGPIAQAIYGVDYKGDVRAGGVMPGQTGWPILSSLMPRIVTSPLEALARGWEDNLSTTELLVEAAEYLSGFQITSLPDFLDREIMRLAKEGRLTRVEKPEEGYGWWQVADKNDIEANVLYGLSQMTKASKNFAERLQREVRTYDKGLLR